MYVICTLRDFFHMGSVEWVTFQEPDSHDRRGGMRDGEAAVVERDEGARRVAIGENAMAVADGLTWRSKTRGNWRYLWVRRLTMMEVDTATAVDVWLGKCGSARESSLRRCGKLH